MNIISKFHNLFYDSLIHTCNKMFDKFENLSNVKKKLVVACFTFLSILFILIIRCDCLYDVKNFIQYWVDYLNKDGLFSVYNHLYDESHFVNYPPLYLSYLYIVKNILNFMKLKFGIGGIIVFFQLQNVIVHLLISWFCKLKFGNKIAFLWFFNPLFLYVNIMTIHFDELFAFVMICCVLAMKNKNDFQVYFLFGLGCLLKLQGAYLLPLIIWYIVSDCGKIKRRLFTCVCVGITCLSCFIPFILSNGNIMLPIHLYIGSNGFNSNYFASFLPTNMFGLLSDGTLVYYGMTHKMTLVMYVNAFAQLTNFLLLILSIFYVYYLLDKKKVNILEATFAYFFCIYYTNWSQAQRYSVYFIAFGIIVGTIYKKYEDWSYEFMTLQCFSILFTTVLNTHISTFGFNIVTAILFAIYIVFWLMFMHIFIQYQKYIFKRDVHEIE